MAARTGSCALVTDTHLLDRLDPSGAIEEAAVAAGATRRGLIAGMAGGAGLLSLGGLFSAVDADAQARPSRRRDLRIVSFALLLEQLGASFYLEAINNRTLPRTSQELLFAVTVRRDELAHVRVVRAAIRQLGGTPTPPPRFQFGETTRNIELFRETASQIENLCVFALNGAGPLVTKPTLALAARMVSVEARQAAWIDDIRNADPFPAAFDPAITLGQVAQRVNATNFVPTTVRAPRV